MNPELHPAPQEQIPVGLLDALRSGNLASLPALGVDDAAMRRHAKDPSVRAAAACGYIERIGTTFRQGQETLRKTIGLTDAEFRTPEAKEHAAGRIEFLLVNGEFEPVAAIERLAGLGPNYFSSADVLSRIESGIKWRLTQFRSISDIFSDLVKLPLPKEFFQRADIREAAAKVQGVALKNGNPDAIDVMRRVGMTDDQFAELKDSARKGADAIVSRGDGATFQSYAEAFDIRPEDIGWQEAILGYLALIKRGQLDEALAFAQKFSSLTEERRLMPGLDLFIAAHDGIRAMAREGRFEDVERLVRLGGLSEDDVLRTINTELSNLIENGNGIPLEAIRARWNVPQATIQTMGENAIRKITRQTSFAGPLAHDVWERLVRIREMTGLPEDRFEEAVIAMEMNALLRSDPYDKIKIDRIRAPRAKLPIDSAFAARFERRLACAFLGQLLMQPRVSAIYSARTEFPFLDDATVRGVAADTVRDFLGTDPGRIEGLHNIQHNLKTFHIETLSYGELAKEARAFIAKKNRYLNRTLFEDLFDGVLKTPAGEREWVLGELRETVRNELLFHAIGKPKEYLDDMFALYGLSWESFSLDQIPLEFLLSSKEPELVERAKRDPWHQTIDALAKLQGRSANEEHDPWKRELFPLVGRVTREEPLLDRNSAKDGTLLVEYVKTFGMLDLPNVSRVYFRLKKGPFASLPEDGQRMLVDLIGPRAARMESENLINEMRKLRPSFQGDLLADVVPRKVGTALGEEAFLTIRGSTQWDRGDRPGATFETWTQTVAAAKAEIARLETEALEAVEARDDAEATRLYAAATERRELIAVAPGYEETSMTVARRLRREPVQAAVSAEIDRLMNLDEFPDGKRGNIKIEAVYRELVDVVRRSFEDAFQLIPQELSERLREEFGENAPDKESLEKLTALGQDASLVSRMEELAERDPLDAKDARLLLAVSAIHLARVAPAYWADVLSRTAPLNITAGLWSVFTDSYLKEHYLNPAQDETHIGHTPFSETLRLALGRVWQAADEGPENELLRVDVILKRISLAQPIFSKETIDVSLVPVQGPLRIYAGDIGDACYSSQHGGMARGEYPRVKALVFVTNRGNPRERLNGSVLFVETRIEATGERILVIRANNPRQNLVMQIDDAALTQQTVDAAVATARRRGIRHVGVVRDPPNAASSNRAAISNFYASRYADRPTVELVNEPETNFNGYPIWDSSGGSPTVVVWTNDDPEAT